MGFMLRILLTFVSATTALCSVSKLVLQHRLTSVPSGFTNVGAIHPDQTIELLLALKSNDMEGLESKVLSISNPGSAEFRQWLSKDEVKAFVQPSEETMNALTSFLQSQSLPPPQVVSPNGEFVSLTLPIHQANTLLGANFELFKHEQSGDQFVRTLEFSLPQELVGVVNTVHPTTSFTDPIDVRLLPKEVRRARESAARRKEVLKRQVAASCNNTITPACLEELYGIPTTPATQKSNTLLVTGYVSEFAQTADLQNFLTQFQPLESPTTSFTLLTLDNGRNPQAPAQAGTEANLDIEYTVGVALGVPASFLSVGGNDFTKALLDTTTFLSGVDNPPSVMTTSYGTNENSITPSLATQICNGYMAVGARGVSVLFASGDGGVRGNHDSLNQCTSNTFIPVFPASCPFVTSVGSTIGINPERAINFTGGGFSNVFARPSFQSPPASTAVQTFLANLPSNFVGTFNRSGRGYPDLALQGWNFEIVSGGATGLVGGTSCSSPSFAGLVALLNDRLVAAGKPVLGFLNPWIYSTASGAFTDITIGKNVGFTCPSTSSGFTAATGWDPLTGFGTPVFSKLLAAAGL